MAPVYDEHDKEWEVCLPEDVWIHLATKEEYGGGKIKVSAELGNIPVFYRKNSKFKDLFDSIEY